MPTTGRSWPGPPPTRGATSNQRPPNRRVGTRSRRVGTRSRRVGTKVRRPCPVLRRSRPSRRSSEFEQSENLYLDPPAADGANALPEKSLDHRFRLSKRSQVPARDRFDIDAETFADDSTLELKRKQPIVDCADEARRHVRPPPERPRIVERSARLSWRWRGLRLGKKLGIRVVKEDLPRIKRGIRVTTVSDRLAPRRLLLTGIGPPITAGLPRPRGHRIEHDDPGDVETVAGQWHAKPAHRLRDEDHRPRRRCVDDGRGVFGQAGGVVVGRQVNGDGSVSTLEEPWNEPVEVPRLPTGSWDEDE